MPLDESIVIAASTRRVRTVRRIMRALPANPRCKICYSPFKGPGGLAVRLFGYGPSRKNPSFCNTCFEKAPLGGRDEEVGILFADIRGYTAMTERMKPQKVQELLARLYAVATDVLMRSDALIDKLVGDEVMALYEPYFVPADQCVGKMVGAAEELLHAVGYGDEGGPWCPLGIGLDFGTAFVGNIGAGDVKDYTAIGDVVNTAARLQAQANGGEIVMSKSVYDIVRQRYPHARPQRFELKGKAEPVEAWVVDLNAAAVAA